MRVSAFSELGSVVWLWGSNCWNCSSLFELTENFCCLFTYIVLDRYPLITFLNFVTVDKIHLKQNRLKMRFDSLFFFLITVHLHSNFLSFVNNYYMYIFSLFKTKKVPLQNAASGWLFTKYSSLCACFLFPVITFWFTMPCVLFMFLYLEIKHSLTRV